MNSRARIALYYAVILILSSTFMRDIFNFSVHLIGRSSLVGLIWLAFFAASVGLLFAFRRLAARQRGLLLLLVVLGCLYALSFEIFEERVHLLKYGLLSLLIGFAVADRRNSFSILCFCILGVTLTACCDELVQSITPGRVGDLRDIFFDAMGGLWGGLIFLVVRDPHRSAH